MITIMLDKTTEVMTALNGAQEITFTVMGQSFKVDRTRYTVSDNTIIIYAKHQEAT